MLSKEDWMYIKSQKEKGIYLVDIAADLGVHPKTVRRALRRAGTPGRLAGPGSASLIPSSPRSTPF